MPDAGARPHLPPGSPLPLPCPLPRPSCLAPAALFPRGRLVISLSQVRVFFYSLSASQISKDGLLLCLLWKKMHCRKLFLIKVNKVSLFLFFFFPPRFHVVANFTSQMSDPKGTGQGPAQGTGDTRCCQPCLGTAARATRASKLQNRPGWGLPRAAATRKMPQRHQSEHQCLEHHLQTCRSGTGVPNTPPALLSLCDSAPEPFLFRFPALGTFHAEQPGPAGDTTAMRNQTLEQAQGADPKHGGPGGVAAWTGGKHNLFPAHTQGCEMQDLSCLGCSWWPSQGISGCSNSYLTCGEPALPHIPVS